MTEGERKIAAALSALYVRERGAYHLRTALAAMVFHTRADCEHVRDTRPQEIEPGRGDDRTACRTCAGRQPRRSVYERRGIRTV